MSVSSCHWHRCVSRLQGALTAAEPRLALGFCPAEVLSMKALTEADICACGCGQGMEGARIGIWCAHGEGLAKFPEAQVYHDVLAQDLAPIRHAQASWVGHAS